MFGAHGRIRTSDRLVRSQVLYPAELHARVFSKSVCWLDELHLTNPRVPTVLCSLTRRLFKTFRRLSKVLAERNVMKLHLNRKRLRLFLSAFIQNR